MPIKVLIVDDEMETCRMFALGLKVAGMQAEYSLSGTQALAKFAAFQPDAVILDLMMPDLDGFEVTRRLRANPDTVKVPIIVVSATASHSDQRRLLTPDVAADALAAHYAHDAVLCHQVEDDDG